MSRVKNGYTALAPLYDFLARLLLGKNIQHMQLIFLNQLIAKKKLLILGGGTGWILPHIEKINPDIVIDYLDISAGMIRCAKKRGGRAVIRFVEGTEHDIPMAGYDCVITNFYLDLFCDTDLPAVIDKIKKSMIPKSLWFVTDFISTTYWDKAMLKFMYLFFRIITGLKTSRLPDWDQAIQLAGGEFLVGESSKRGFIKSIVYQV